MRFSLPFLSTSHNRSGVFTWYLLLSLLLFSLSPAPLWAEKIWDEIQPSTIADESNPVDEVLWKGIIDRNKEAVLEALKNGANINARSKPVPFAYSLGSSPPLLVAVITADAEMVNLLLDNGASLHTGEERTVDDSLLFWAARQGKEETFALLRERGKKIPPPDTQKAQIPPLLTGAAAGGSLEIFHMLLENGYSLPETKEQRYQLLQTTASGSRELFASLFDKFSPELSQEQRFLLPELASESVLLFLYQRKDVLEPVEGYIQQALAHGYGNLAARMLQEHPEAWTPALDAQVQNLLKEQPYLLFDFAVFLTHHGQVEKIRGLLPRLIYQCGLRTRQDLLQAVLQSSLFSQQEKADFRGYALIGSCSQLSALLRWPEDEESRKKARQLRAYSQHLLAEGLVNYALTTPEGSGNGTALGFALAGHDYALAQSILATNPDLSQTHDSFRLVNSACRSGDHKLVANLLKLGASPDPPENWGPQTPLSSAIQAGDERMVDLLLKAGADPNRGIHESRRYGQYSPKKTPLLLALEQGNPAIIQRLLNNSQRPLTARSLGYGVGFAQSIHQDLLVQLLVASIQELNAPEIRQEIFQNKTPLLWALENDAPWLLQKMHYTGKQLIPKGYTAEDLLCYFISEKKLAMVDYLLAQGLPMNVRCQEQYSLLDMAAHVGSPEAIELLLKHGASIHPPASGKGTPQRGRPRSHSGWSPLFFAIDANATSTVQALLEHGAATSRLASVSEGPSHEDQKTPLIFAVTKGSLDLVKLLLEHGADVNQANSNGYTPLMAAVDKGDPQMVRFLRLRGADKSLRHRTGSTAVDRIGAIKNWQTKQEILSLLTDKEAVL